MKTILLKCLLLLAIAAMSARADLFESDEKKLSSLADIPLFDPKEASKENSSSEHGVRDFFENLGCQLKKSATKVTEQAKKLGSGLKEGAIKLGEKAKDLGLEIQTKFIDIKDKLTHDTLEEQQNPHNLAANVEMINPDILKAEQMCGHGHILDALGNCSKLRK